MQDFNNINIWNKRLDSQKNLFEYLEYLKNNFEPNFKPNSKKHQLDYLNENTKNYFIAAFSLLDFNKINNLDIEVDNGMIVVNFEYEGVEVTLEVYNKIYNIIFSEEECVRFYEREELQYLNQVISKKLINYKIHSD